MKKIISLLLLLLNQYALYAQSDTNNEENASNSNEHFKIEDIQSTSVATLLNKDILQSLGGSATGLLGRISGVTFINGSLVSFRGLSPRYTQITIDGLSAPITQQNIKAFALGLLPGTSVQELSVYKSGNYVNQGEWGGSVVNISTNASLNKDFTQISFGLGYQHNFTFNDFVKDKEYGRKFGDAFGYGVKPRDFTNDIVEKETLQSFNRSEAANEGKNLRNSWGLETRNGVPNFQIGFSLGRILSQKGDKKISTINSFVYDRKESGIHYNRARYTGYERNNNEEVIDSEVKDFMTDGVYQTKTDISINSAWNFQFNKDNALNIDLIYSHSGANKTMARYFVGLSNNKELFYAQYGIISKEIFLTRLSGVHHFGSRSKLNWSMGVNSSFRNEPDLRRSAAQRNLDQQDFPFILVIPESSKADLGARFNSHLDDLGLQARFDYTFGIKENNLFDLKLGFLFETIEREFEARIITSAKDDFTDPELRFVTAANLGNTFTAENYGPEGYFLVDGTTEFEFYNARNILFGGYIGLDNQFGEQWKTSLGLRIENFDQTLASGDIDVDNNKTNYLPYVNLNFLPNDFTSIKFGYSMSVNRPAFRELAPFTFFDFDYRADIQGNADLKNATLHHLDLGLMFIFRQNEYFNLNFFYKNINNPIEMIYIIRSERPLFSFSNTNGAELAGVELEFMTALSHRKEQFLHNFFFNGNFTYTNSVIELGEDTNEVASSRALQGQIPISMALGLTYLAPSTSSQVTLSYRYIGKSLYSVGDGQETFPWYNKPMNFLNAGFSYKFKSNVKLSIAAINLLNAPLVQIEDTNLNGNIDDPVDNEVQYGLNYQTYNLSVNYNF